MVYGCTYLKKLGSQLLWWYKVFPPNMVITNQTHWQPSISIHSRSRSQHLKPGLLWDRSIAQDRVASRSLQMSSPHAGMGKETSSPYPFQTQYRKVHGAQHINVLLLPFFFFLTPFLRLPSCKSWPSLMSSPRYNSDSFMIPQLQGAGTGRHSYFKTMISGQTTQTCSPKSSGWS